MLAIFTYKALSKWHQHLFSTCTNALMMDFLTLREVIQVTKHKSEWMCSSALHWGVHQTPKNIHFYASYWILRGCNTPLVWLLSVCQENCWYGLQMVAEWYRQLCWYPWSHLLCHLCEEIGWRAFKCRINDKQSSTILLCSIKLHA